MELRDLAEAKLKEMALGAMEDGFDSLTDEEKHREFVKLLRAEKVDNKTLLDSLVMTYEKSVKDNEEDFMCLSEMIVSLVAILKAKGFLNEEEAQVIYDIPKRRLEEKK